MAPARGRLDSIGPHTTVPMPDTNVLDRLHVMIYGTKSLLEYPNCSPHLMRISSTRPQAARQPLIPLPSSRGNSPLSVARVCVAPSTGDVLHMRLLHLLLFHFPCIVPFAWHANRARPPRSFPKDTKRGPFSFQHTHQFLHQPSRKIKPPSVNANVHGCREAIRQPKKERNSVGAPRFLLAKYRRKSTFDPTDLTEFFCCATPHCTETAAARFATVDCLGTLI